jgi:uncharacterized membrane protein YbhN (UPF0104 family)
MVATAEKAHRRRFGLLLRISVSALLVALLAGRMDWRATGSALEGVHWELCGLAWLLYVSSQVTSALRWSRLARPLGFDVSFLRFLRLYFEGSFFGLCLPGSIGGDVVKACRLAVDFDGRLLAACSVLMDRLSGLSALLVLSATGLVARRYQLSWPAALGVGVLVSTGAVLSTTSLASFAGRWSRPKSDQLASGVSLWSKLAVYSRRRPLLWHAFGWSLVVQCLNVSTVFTLAQALEVDAPIVAFFVAVPLVALAATIPISLQGVGLREGGLALLLASSGVSEEQGVTLGFLWFLTAVASGLLGGVVYVSRQREKLSSPPVPQSLPAAPPRSAFGHPLPKSAGVLQSALNPISLSATLNRKRATMSLSVVVPIYNELENVHRLC